MKHFKQKEKKSCSLEVKRKKNGQNGGGGKIG